MTGQEIFRADGKLAEVRHQEDVPWGFSGNSACHRRRPSCGSPPGAARAGTAKSAWLLPYEAGTGNDEKPDARRPGPSRQVTTCSLGALRLIPEAFRPPSMRGCLNAGVSAAWRADQTVQSGRRSFR
jgi:hypothetical protein